MSEPSKLQFSVILPTYKRTAILLKTLQCLEAQHTDIAFEVIVVDDGSAGPIPEMGFGNGKRATWKLLRNERNLGRAVTRNRGIREATGEHILMVDNDIWATPSLIQAHYDAQKRISGGVVVGRMPISEEVPHDIWNDYYRQWLDGLGRLMEESKNDLPYRFFFTGNLSIPMSLLQRVGLFDEGFKGYSGEDTELGYRLKQAGVRMVYEPKAVGFHYNCETLDTILNKRFHMGFASLTMARRHPELSAEFSRAGLLAPGRKYLQWLLVKPILVLGKYLCQLSGILNIKPLCLFCLAKLSQAYSAYGLKLALNETG